jgi:carboxymethylenebutenolidase
MLHFGELDHTTPPELMARIVPAVEANEHVTHFIYEGAGHAFANHTRPKRYNEAVTKTVDERTFSFFGAQLGAGAPRTKTSPT